MLSATAHISVNLPGCVPFGFKMQGGREYRAPLTILSVSVGSKAYKEGLRHGDVILSIDSVETHMMEHTAAIKLIKTAKNGLDINLTRGARSNEEGLQAMKQYSANERSNSVSSLPPPPERLNSISSIPPPPAEEEELLASQEDLPPPPPGATPPSPPITPPKARPVDMPQSSLTRFGSEVTDIAQHKDSAMIVPAKRNLDSWISDMAVEPPARLSNGAKLAPTTPVTPPEMTRPTPPEVARPTPEGSGETKPRVHIPPSRGFSLASMAYSPSPKGATPALSRGSSSPSISSTSSSTSSTPYSSSSSTPSPRTVSPNLAKLMPASSLTSNSDDIKKKFDGMDLSGGGKFSNKGSFYSRCPLSPETPSPSTQAGSAPPTFPSPPNEKRGRAVKEEPVRPAVRPITPPAEEPYPPPNNIVRKGSKFGPTCASPLPKYQTGSSDIFNKRRTGDPRKQTPVRPNMVPDPLSGVTAPLSGVTAPLSGVTAPRVSPMSAAARTISHNVPLVDPAPAVRSPNLANFKYSTPDSDKPKSPSPQPFQQSPTKTSPFSKSPSTQPSAAPEISPFSKSPFPKSPSPNSTPATQGSPTKDQSIQPLLRSISGKSLIAPKPLLLPICKACSQEIRGPYVGAQGRAWHPDHFNCSSCSGDLSQGFKEVEDVLYCGTCYFDQFGEKCDSCGKSIAGSVVQAIGKSYHPEHFTCAGCDNVLTDGFSVDNGKPYCPGCQLKTMPECAGCGGKIEGTTKWICALEKDWHNGCFTCSVCKAPLAGKSFYQANGEALCQVHASATRIRAH